MASNQSQGGSALLDAPPAEASSEAKLAAMQKQLDKAVEALLAQQAVLDKQATLVQTLAAKVAGDEPAKPAEPIIQLVNTSVDPQRALERIADSWPKDASRPAPTRVITKTYRVSPLVKGKAVATIANCFDESDAKSFYGRALNKNEAIACRVEEISQQTHTFNAPADPASAAADAA